jgi:predicted transglutaminase-like protease
MTFTESQTGFKTVREVRDMYIQVLTREFSVSDEDVVIRYIRSIWKQATANGQSYHYIWSIEFDTTVLFDTQAEADTAAANLSSQSWVDAVS